MGDSSAVTLNVDGQSIECDKATLVNGSDYFKAMFNSNMIETKTNQVNLKDEDIDIVKSLVECLTTGELQIQDNIEELTAASVRYQMKTVTDMCVSFLKKTLDDSNCNEISILASSLCQPQLYKYAKRHALYYFCKVIDQDGFLCLEKEDVIEYLSDRHLNCKSELDVLCAISKWIQNDLERNLPYLPDILACFHPEDLDADEWDSLENCHILKNTEFGIQWLQQIKECNVRNSDLLSNKYHEMPVTILSVGERIKKDGHLNMDVWKFSKEDHTMKHWIKFHCNPIGTRIVVIGKDFYMTGGQTIITRVSFMKDVWKFDGFKMTWEKVTELPLPRRHHAACASNTKIFLMGGFGKFRDVLDSAQEYDIINDTWRDLATMKSKGYSLQAEYCQDKIYLCRERTIECLDLQTDTWTEISLVDFIGTDTVSVMPVVYKNWIYLFKYNKYYHVAGEGVLFKETWKHTQEWTRMNTDTLEFHTYPCSDKLMFGHKVEACNGKLYMLNYNTNDLVITDLNDLRTFKKLGTSGKEDDHCSIVVLPDYPTT